MDSHEVLLMKSLAMSLSESSGFGTVCLTGRAAGELGKLILEALEELECEKDSVAAYRVACAALEKERDSLKGDVSHLMTDRDVMRDERDRAAKERDSLKAERDELKGKIGSAAQMQREYLDRCNAAIAERDSLKERYEREMASFKDGNARLASLLDASLKERDSMREKFEKALTLRDRVIEEIQEVKKERDFLQAKVDSFTPIIVEFASELRGKSQGLIDKVNQASGGGVA